MGAVYRSTRPALATQCNSRSHRYPWRKSFRGLRCSCGAKYRCLNLAAREVSWFSYRGKLGTPFAVEQAVEVARTGGSAVQDQSPTTGFSSTATLQWG